MERPTYQATSRQGERREVSWYGRRLRSHETRPFVVPAALKPHCHKGSFGEPAVFSAKSLQFSGVVPDAPEDT
jgi:hypothetical protein